MAQQATTSAQTADGHEHGPFEYIKVWAILLALLVVSVLGPMLGHPVLTLITAFGIALIKAYLVAKKFMHLNLEPRYVVYLLVTCVAFMLLFFAGVAPDVMRHDGYHWENVAAEAEVKRVLGDTQGAQVHPAALGTGSPAGTGAVSPSTPAQGAPIPAR
jgi:caa(3)-type oxidase subunit IV